MSSLDWPRPPLLLPAATDANWADLVQPYPHAFLHARPLVTIFSTVVTLMAVGAIVGRFLNMYPIEAAIINACHSGQGGTGAVAILTASNRMQLMPFAQIATRIGGGLTVTLTLLALARFG